MRNFVRILQTALGFLVVTTVGAAIYALVTSSGDWLGNVVTANLAVGAILAAGGVLLWFAPTRLVNKGKIDSSNTELFFEAQRKKRISANRFIYIGILQIVIILIIEFAIWLI